MKDYRTAKSWTEEAPEARLIILMSSQGKIINWHCSTPEPEGEWVLIGVIN